MKITGVIIESQTLTEPTTQHDRHNEPQANHYLAKGWPTNPSHATR